MSCLMGNQLLSFDHDSFDIFLPSALVPLPINIHVLTCIPHIHAHTGKCLN